MGMRRHWHLTLRKVGTTNGLAGGGQQPKTYSLQHALGAADLRPRVGPVALDGV